MRNRQREAADQLKAALGDLFQEDGAFAGRFEPHDYATLGVRHVVTF